MKCPHCKTGDLFHYQDAYVVTSITKKGKLSKRGSETNTYDESFVECADCGMSNRKDIGCDYSDELNKIHEEVYS